ncbi:2-dehydropantoate 2-reductase [Peribacillus loiseleuriae]|uniref:ketopantoate reductase family protein n=1 Tax=Peribacillus loiseleuriae TaxID=1679170 RepID=UPI00316ABE90
MLILNIVIIGAGAIGAYYGARWQEAGQHVQFLVRENRARLLSENGLYITSSHGNYVFNDLHFADNLDGLTDPDLVVLAVKGYHLQGTIPALKTLVDRGAKVIPLLNGLEHIALLQKELGEEAIIGGSAYIITTLDEKGHVVHTSSSHDLLFGPLHPSQQSICKELEEISRNAIMNVHYSNDIMLELWKKYIFITAFSGVTTATNFSIGTIRKYPDTFELLHQVLLEMKGLANLNGVAINEEHIAQFMKQFDKLPEESTSSMHQDRRKELTLEVEHIQGGALRLAEKVGIKLPITEQLYRQIKPFEN